MVIADNLECYMKALVENKPKTVLENNIDRFFNQQNNLDKELNKHEENTDTDGENCHQSDDKSDDLSNFTLIEIHDNDHTLHIDINENGIN